MQIQDYFFFSYWQEITLWRKGERVRRPIQQQLLAQQAALQQMGMNSHAAEKQSQVISPYEKQDETTAAMQKHQQNLPEEDLEVGLIPNLFS